MSRVKASDIVVFILLLILVSGGGYLAITKAYWEWQNPKANWTTYWTEMPAPLRFERLAKYQ